MKVRVSRQANADLDEIFSFVATDKPVAAAGLIEALLVAMAQLADFPFMGRQGRRRGTRELPTVPPYIIVYSTSSRHVNVDRILHSAQRR